MRHSRRSSRADSTNAALDAVEAGWGGHVWIGEPGSGKSLLLERCLDEVHRRPDCIVVRLTNLTSFVRRVQLLTGEGSLFESRDNEDAESLALRISAELPRDRTTIAVVDNLDALDAVERVALLGLATTRMARVVLLATARTDRSVRPAPHPVVTSAVHPLDATETLHLLHEEEGLAVAPHVAAALSVQLAGNVGGILQTAAELDADQLAGTRALPDPLPVTLATTAVYGAAVDALTDAERTTLLIASVAVSHRTETLLAASGLSLDQLIGGRVADHVQFVAGRFDILDPRVRSLVHSTATLAARTRAHERLAAVHTDLNEPGLAAWHTSLAALAGLPEIAPALVALARHALKRGDSAWAYDVAREATSQAADHDRPAAELTAGLAALQSGFVLDAVYWLGRVLRSGDPTASDALAPYTIAVTLAHGRVPEVEFDFDDARSSRNALGVIGSLAAAAVLHAERGDGAAAARCLADGGTLSARLQIGADLLQLAAAWCAVFGTGTGNAVPLVSPSSSWLHGYLAVCAGLALVESGNSEHAAGVLSSAVLGLARGGISEGSPDVAASPLLDAHLRVAHALALMAGGEFAAAADSLERAAFLGPVSLVFAGLGVSAARRLSVLMSGTVSTVPAALERVIPGAASALVRRQSLIDQSFAASFAGNATEAATLISLAGESAAHGIELVLPALDETRLWLDAEQRQRAVTASRRAPSGLRASLALDPAKHARDDWAAAIEASRGIHSPFDRALTELALGTAMAESGEPRRARPHLLAAIEVFFHSGAAELTAQARELTAALLRHDEASVSVREDWADGLTEREFEVASLVVLGTTNREVASQLHLSVRTVEVHVARVFAKLDVHSRTELSYQVHGRGTSRLRSTT